MYFVSFAKFKDNYVSVCKLTRSLCVSCIRRNARMCAISMPWLCYTWVKMVANYHV